MATTTRERDKERKKSGKTNHRTKNMRVHFHTDGQICPSTFGEDCPNDSDWDGSEEGETYQGDLSVQDLISQLAVRGGTPGSFLNEPNICTNFGVVILSGACFLYFNIQFGYPKKVAHI